MKDLNLVIVLGVAAGIILFLVVSVIGHRVHYWYQQRKKKAKDSPPNAQAPPENELVMWPVPNPMPEVTIVLPGQARPLQLDNALNRINWSSQDQDETYRKALGWKPKSLESSQHDVYVSSRNSLETATLDGSQVTLIGEDLVELDVHNPAFVNIEMDKLDDDYNDDDDNIDDGAGQTTTHM